MLGNKYNAALQNLELREKFFTKIALLRILQKKYGIIKHGYVIPVRGREKEFKYILKETLKNAGIEKEKEN